MAPAVAISSTTSDNPPALGGLFAGVSFFLAQRLPSRSTFVNKVQSNGGRVVRLEAQADYLIADHARTDCPPGSISYTFIDAAIRSGALPDPAEHPAGPVKGAVREVGSTSVPGKQTRTAFSAEDDRVLWNWVEKAKREGGLVKGNEIYKQLERVNPRHTHQAWRDRYIKKLMDTPPAGVEVHVQVTTANGSLRESSDRPSSAQPEDSRAKKRKIEHTPERPEQEPLPNEEEAAEPANRDPPTTFVLPRGSQPQPSTLPTPAPEFDDEDFANLMENAAHIVKIAPDRYEEAWVAWAMLNDTHTADDWQEFWEQKVRPAFLAKKEARKTSPRKRRKNGKGKVEDAEQSDEEEDEEREARRPSARKAQREGVEKYGNVARRQGSVESVTERMPQTPKAHGKTNELANGVKSEDDKQTVRKPKNEEHEAALDGPATSPRAGNLSTRAIEVSSSDEEVQAAPSAPTEPLNKAPSPVPQESLNDLRRDLAALNKRHRLGRQKRKDGVRYDHSPVQALAASDQQTSGLGKQRVNGDTQMDGARDEDDALLPLDLPTSDANRAADHQLRRESIQREDGGADEQDATELPTSDANFAAEQQLRRESAEPGVEVEEADENVVGEDDVTMQELPPDVNGEGGDITISSHLVEDGEVEDGLPGEEILDEPADALDQDVDGEGGDITISSHLVEDDEVEDGLPGEEIIDEPGESGDALTEANLASQQAQHLTQPLKGTDLPVDDEMQDQTDFLTYLQGLAEHVKEGVKAPEAAAEVAQAALEKIEVEDADDPNRPTGAMREQTQYTQNEHELPTGSQEPQTHPPDAPPFLSQEEQEDFDQTQYTTNETVLFSNGNVNQEITSSPSFPDLPPISSQDEIDEIMEMNAEWPASPKAMKRRKVEEVQSQSQQFETQVQYPSLPPNERGEGLMSGTKVADAVVVPPKEMPAEAMPLSQAETPVGVDYLTLPRDSTKSRHQDFGTEATRDDEISSMPDIDGLPTTVGIPANAGMNKDEEDEEQDVDDLDLTIAEPDGGFGDGEVDLTVVEPDGGFGAGFSSSPAKRLASQSSQRSMQRAEVKNLGTPVRTQRTRTSPLQSQRSTPRPQQRPAVEEVIEVSSAASSSSAYESSEAGSDGQEDVSVDGDTAQPHTMQQGQDDMALLADSDDQEEHAAPRALETQDILNAETQQPDLGMPLPPDDDDEFEELPSDPLKARASVSAQPQYIEHHPPPGQPHHEPTSAAVKQKSQNINLSETQTLDPSDDDDVNTFFATVFVRYGIRDEATIINALKATSMRPELAEIVLLEQKAGRGFPKDLPGCWEQWEDDALEGGDARLSRLVNEKHGWNEMKARLEFLAEWRKV